MQIRAFAIADTEAIVQLWKDCGLTRPWNNPYKYANPGAGGGVEILSLGADGVAGGDGENADIRNKP